MVASWTAVFCVVVIAVVIWMACCCVQRRKQDKQGQQEPGTYPQDPNDNAVDEQYRANVDYHFMHTFTPAAGFMSSPPPGPTPHYYTPGPPTGNPGPLYYSPPRSAQSQPQHDSKPILLEELPPYKC